MSWHAQQDITTSDLTCYFQESAKGAKEGNRNYYINKVDFFR
jgi:hypothetical protein